MQSYQEQKTKFHELLQTLNRTETAKEVMTWCNDYALKNLVSRNKIWDTVYDLLKAGADPEAVFNRLKNGESL